MKHFRSLLLLAAALAFTWITPPLASAADLSITAAKVIPGARAKQTYGTAGVAITQGQLLYFDSSAGTYKLADANASATTAAVVGYAANAASTGQLVTVITEDDDMTVNDTALLSMTAPVYVLSGTAGGIAPSLDLTTGWYPAVVLIAKSTTKASFKIIKGPAACAMLHLDLPAARFAFVRLPGFDWSVLRREETELALAA